MNKYGVSVRVFSKRRAMDSVRLAARTAARRLSGWNIFTLRCLLNGKQRSPTSICS